MGEPTPTCRSRAAYAAPHRVPKLISHQGPCSLVGRGLLLGGGSQFRGVGGGEEAPQMVSLRDGAP